MPLLAKTFFHLETPSTRIRIFLKTHIYLSVLAFRPHVAGVFGDENEAFRKRCPGWRFLKTPFSCCRVDGRKRIFSKTMTSPAYFCTVNSTNKNFLLVIPPYPCGRRFFLKTLIVWTQIFSKTDKEICVFKNIRIRVHSVALVVCFVHLQLSFVM